MYLSDDHVRSCMNMSNHLSSSICDSSPKTYNPQIAIQFATRKLRFRSFPIPPISLQPTGCDSSRGCDSSPKTCILQVAIQFATCKLRFQSQNLHPAGCDLIRNLQVAIPVPKACNLQVAIHFPEHRILILINKLSCFFIDIDFDGFY